MLRVNYDNKQLEVANRHAEWHAKNFGFNKPNTEFKKGIIEDLAAAGILGWCW
jgi:hypothetical protein